MIRNNKHFMRLYGNEFRQHIHKMLRSFTFTFTVRWCFGMLLISWYLMYEWERIESNGIACKHFGSTMSTFHLGFWPPHRLTVAVVKRHHQTIYAIFCWKCEHFSPIFVFIIHLNWSHDNISCIVDGEPWTHLGGTKQLNCMGTRITAKKRHPFLASDQFFLFSLSRTHREREREGERHAHINWNDFIIVSQINAQHFGNEPKGSKMKSPYDYNENIESDREYPLQMRGGYHVSSAYDTLYIHGMLTQCTDVVAQANNIVFRI